MDFMSFWQKVTDPVLFVVCIFLLSSSVYLTWKMKFVQVRSLPFLYRHLRSSLSSQEENGRLTPHRALLTAMSTTLGISTLVGPVIAIRMGGPGALLGFLLTSFFGAAATYVEVSLSVHYRKKVEGDKVVGGPMQYLKHLFSAKAASWYAVCCFLLMMGWSAAQANQLAAILDSPLLGSYRVPTLVSALGLVILVLLTLVGGIKRIGSFSAKLVPVMFLLYIGSSLWIVLSHIGQIGELVTTIISSAFAPQALASGALVGGVVSAFRWGVFKGVQSTEAGVGTQTIPHSLAETKDPRAQGALAMLSTFSAGGVAFLSGLVALITNTWQDPSLPLGISMVAASYQTYFSLFGIAIVAISALLFAFGTIVGNSFNGGQCFAYLTNHTKEKLYLFLTAVMVFLGAMGEVRVVWSTVDICLALIAVPHMAALLVGAKRHPELFLEEASRVRSVQS